MNWIAQHDIHGCGIAVLAMLTGQSYETVRSGFLSEYAEKGMTEWGMNGYLAEHGYAVAVKYPHYGPLKCHRDIWPPLPFADVHYCCVWTISATNHFVVMLRDGRIMDPATPEPHVLSDYQAVHHVAGVVRIDADSS